jgi:hypothetical protein
MSIPGGLVCCSLNPQLNSQPLLHGHRSRQEQAGALVPMSSRVRSTLQDLDNIEAMIDVLNAVPPQVNIK